MTSGFGLPPRSRALRAAGLEVVEISLDTFDETAFNRRRGHREAFRIALDAAEAALADGFYVVLGMLIDGAMLARDAFDGYMRRASALGVHEVRVYGARPSVPLGRHRFRGLTSAQLARVAAFQRRWNGEPDAPTVSSIDHAEVPGGYGCTGGTCFAHVSAAGELTPCTMSPVSFGNVRERPLAEVYATLREHYPHSLRRCPLPAVWELIRDVPDDALPVRDEATVTRVSEALRRANPSPADFWRRLDVSRAREGNRA
jgi:MoaA/NifB/PqqE/SkfB family radical SAM enzyme